MGRGPRRRTFRVLTTEPIAISYQGHKRVGTAALSPEVAVENVAEGCKPPELRRSRRSATGPLRRPFVSAWPLRKPALHKQRVPICVWIGQCPACRRLGPYGYRLSPPPTSRRALRIWQLRRSFPRRQHGPPRHTSEALCSALRHIRMHPPLQWHCAAASRTAVLLRILEAPCLRSLLPI